MERLQTQVMRHTAFIAVLGEDVTGNGTCNLTGIHSEICTKCEQIEYPAQLLCIVTGGLTLSA